MNPKKLLQNLSFIKEVTSKRQTYYVYAGETEYLLLTASTNEYRYNSFNISAIPRELPEHVARVFRGRKVTAAQVLKLSHKPALMKTSFDALNTLYALCALGTAKIDHRFRKKALHFTIARKTVQ
jgi:hypothetical protein